MKIFFKNQMIKILNKVLGTIGKIYGILHRVYRVPGFLSSRPDWVHPPPQPLTRKRVFLPPGSKGETNSLAGDAVGEPSSDEGTDTQVLYVYYIPSTVYCL